MATQLVTYGSQPSNVRAITGNVTKAGAPLPGAALSATDGSGRQSGRSDISGAFQIVARTGVAGTLDVALAGNSFAPPSVSLAATGPLSGVVFAAATQQNQPPRIALGTSMPVSPNVVPPAYNLGQPVLLWAEASDPDGSIRRIEYFAGNSLLAVTFTPYQGSSTFLFSWYGPGVGTYDVKAVAFDDTGARVESNTIRIAVTRPSNTVWIRGKINTPSQNSVIIAKLTGGVNYSANINTDGSYSYNVPTGGTYFLTPTGDGETFSPASRTFANLQTDVVADFDVVTNREPTASPSLAPIGATARDFAAPNSPCGIPATARAYSLNVTVVPQEPLSYLTVWPAGSARPNVSTLNSFQGKVVANAALVPSGANGDISGFVTNRSDVILDINGYFAP